MQVKDIMTQSFEFIQPDASLQEAARKMRNLDCGFLPISKSSQDRLEGVVTDRDIVVRCIAEGKDPAQTSIAEAETRKVLYCFEDDDLDHAAELMREQQVYRLIVLDSLDSKRMCGIVSLGDVMRHDQTHLGARTAQGIVSHRVTA